MIVNCLPLYEPPPMAQKEASKKSSPIKERLTSSSEEPGTSKEQRRSFLIKARSAEALDTVAAELELHDQDYADYISEGENLSRTVAAAPRKWSRMSAAYSKNMRVMVRNLSDSELLSREDERGGDLGAQQGEAASEVRETDGGQSEDGNPVKVDGGEEGGGEREEEEGGGEREEEGEGVKGEEGGGEREEEGEGVKGEEGGGERGEEEGGEKGEEVKEKETKKEETEQPQIEVERNEVLKDEASQQNPKPSDKAAVSNSPKNPSSKKAARSVKSSSPITEPENGSDEESDSNTLTVNYLDQKQMSTLKRSSGSVSFFYRAETTLAPNRTYSVTVSPRLETSIEANDEDDEDSSMVPLVSKPPLVAETRELLSHQDAYCPSAPPPSSTAATTPINAHPPAATTPPALNALSSLLPFTPSPLPPAPPTVDMEYVERSGWLTKLSHRKGVFGDKWQKRYFVLHRAWLYYFKKYGVSRTASCHSMNVLALK